MSISLVATYLDTLLEPARSRLPDTSYIQTLHHFTTVAHTTVGGPRAQHVALNAIPTIATQHPYLMHAVLGFSSLHLKHLQQHSTNPVQNTHHTLSSSYHWSRALTLFQTTLSNPTNLNRQNMDALLSTSLLLDTMSMSLEGDLSSTSNPLSTPDSSPSTTTSFIYSPNPTTSLNWLAIQSGFKTLMTALSPHIHHSIWLPVFTDADDGHGTYLDERPGRADLPNRLADLCEIDEDDTVESNVYLAPLRLLLPLLQLHKSSSKVSDPSSSAYSSSTSPAVPPSSLTPPSTMFTKLITFPGRIRPEFRALLAKRDHRALLLMGYWFGMACGLEEWWVKGRARREGWAVCEFLEENGGVQIWRLCGWIARACGYRNRDAAGGDEEGDCDWEGEGEEREEGELWSEMR